ncbi:uncharacterized protein LOC135224755 [Macrobrachium nipponense]|uniref:uncharacterized protein LOC135224755 n=1 Tax=Macrobrachium nipponense TaxID=159736 RepID=UPI0030C82A89
MKSHEDVRGVVRRRNKRDKKLGAIAMSISEEGKSLPRDRPRTLLRHIHDNHLLDYQWFYVTNSHTYVIVENLRNALTNYDQNFAIALTEDSHENGQFNCALTGSGYVLSREALKIFGEADYRSEDCNKEFVNKKVSWMGLQITFKNVRSASNLYVYEFFLYKLQVYGVDGRFWGPKVPLLPPDLNAIPQEILNSQWEPHMLASAK